MANRVQLPSFQVRARASAVEKLDAAFIALTRAAEARERQQAGGMVDLVDVVMDVGDIYIYIEWIEWIDSYDDTISIYITISIIFYI